MPTKRKICVVTGTRAEYGLLHLIMKKIAQHNDLELQIIVTGSHLDKRYGSTYQEIEKDGFRINKKIKILGYDDSEKNIIKAMGLAMNKFYNALEQLEPDILLVLGDRYEILAVASTALIMKIPIAHIHGGESTEGLIDEAIRHSVTKMSHIHFVSTSKYKETVIQLGEQKNRVFNFGAPGIERLREIKLFSKNELEKLLKIKFNKKNLLITYHPVTLEFSSFKNDFNEIVEALKKIKDCTFIFTKANADTGGSEINKMIKNFKKNNPKKVFIYDSLGQKAYFSCLKYVDGVVGNSSSGIIEVPSFNIGTINIGDRQKGRVSGKSVINCSPERNQIFNAFKKITERRFKHKLVRYKNPYSSGKTSEKIVQVLNEINIENILKKKFKFIKAS